MTFLYELGGATCNATPQSHLALLPRDTKFEALSE